MNDTGLLNLIPFAARRRTVLILTIASGILSQAATVASLAIGGWLAGAAATGTSPAKLVPLFCALGAAAIAAGVTRWWQADASHDLAFALIEVLQIGIYDGIERAAPRHVLGHRAGDLASVATMDAELMEWFFAHLLGDYVGAIVVPVAALIGLALVHPLIALALLPFLPLVASVPYWLARRSGEQGNALAAEIAALNADVVEGIQGQRDLAIFGQGRAWLARLAGRTRAVGRAQWAYGRRAGLEQAAIDILLAGAVLAVAATGIWLAGQGDLDMALFPLAIVLAGATLAPLTEVTQTARKIGALRAGAARVLTVFRQQEAVADAGRAPAPAQHALRFEKVGFAYEPGAAPALREVDFAVAAGETVALVGRSGAGKSTCASLLMRFWDVDAGAVRIGGVDVRDLPVATLRRLVSIVPQDIHLFDDTIAANIALGRPEATPAEIERAARAARAHDFVMRLPQGYATSCGERGARLSGGERQRLAIARAFLCDAPVLILDEAASNLDAENERAVQEAIDDLRHNRTVLVIAHRPSTIRSADRIVVLEGGRIAETGRHDALIRRHGAYAQLLAAGPDIHG